MLSLGLINSPSACVGLPPVIPNGELLSTKMQKASPRLAQDPADRAQHARSYGCRTGLFSAVDRSIVPERFRGGIFDDVSPVGVEMRFSTTSDGPLNIESSDVKGIALKIKNGARVPLVNFSSVFNSFVPPDQDFLFINRDHFFIADKDLHHYDSLQTIGEAKGLKQYSKAFLWVIAGLLESNVGEAYNRFNLLLAAKSLGDGPADNPFSALFDALRRSKRRENSSHRAI